MRPLIPKPYLEGLLETETFNIRYLDPLGCNWGLAPGGRGCSAVPFLGTSCVVRTGGPILNCLKGISFQAFENGAVPSLRVALLCWGFMV